MHTDGVLPDPAPPGPLDYFASLDAFRAIAALSVLYAHFGSLEPTLVGHHGVRFFFMLSGFLITRNLLQTRQSTTKGVLHSSYIFYARRILRLLPAFYLLVLVSYLVGADENAASPLWFVLHISNLLYMLRNEWDPWALGHTWTLSMEEQFYFIWPWFILLTNRKYISLVCLAGLTASIAYRFYFPLTGEADVRRDLIPLASIDALALGGLIACTRQIIFNVSIR
ncbi:acyltransferase family protein [Croceicoccus marinus]|uniref:Acyltransferase n=1 Tax=Croceicoccus marinus TaxID=450378 RepID=A0A7G6VT04_9SPHN|nr:acyltransferase [Croceicoccus marinus]QNE04869.1 acyltransferase [Croceicoccus marinus]